ncbi:MAG: hypothetical protein A2Y73_06350 [Chloroflexi bacterium RBG_13_56_8]|nr:MAG: hypothetical protein A2Y73_06350 [Chloroflexi bacterium RBG_13_56_8]
MFDTIQPGLAAQRSLVVEEEHTAARWGSGSLLVLSTPEMVALMEGAAVDAVDPLLPPGYQTVGGHVDIRHIAPTPLGSKVTSHATLIEVDGKRLTFLVEAQDEAGKVGEGTHQRFIIEVAKFMQRAQARSE